MLKWYIHFSRSLSDGQKTGFGIATCLIGFSVFNAGYRAGLLLPLIIILYVTSHSMIKGNE